MSEREITLDPNARLFIALPSYQGMTAIQTTMSLLASVQEFMKARVRYRVKPYAGPGYIPLVRNVLVSQFMASNCTHLLFVDADLGWDAEAPLRLLAASQFHDICCGVYPKKIMPIELPVNFYMDEAGRPIRHPETGYFQLKDACTGFMMIRREAIENLMRAYPERQCSFRPNPPEAEAPYEWNLFDCYADPKDRRYLSEDYGFSRLAQNIGISLWADPDLRFRHYGTHEYVGGIPDAMEPSEKESAEAAYR